MCHFCSGFTGITQQKGSSFAAVSGGGGPEMLGERPVALMATSAVGSCWEPQDLFMSYIMQPGGHRGELSGGLSPGLFTLKECLLHLSARLLCPSWSLESGCWEVRRMVKWGGVLLSVNSRRGPAGSVPSLVPASPGSHPTAATARQTCRPVLEETGRGRGREARSGRL